MNEKKLPRGIRNNNPGNIRHGDNWNGLSKDQPDESFCTFVAPEYGIRAMARILRNYYERYNLKTVRDIVSRWAPPSENNTASYIEHVSHKCFVDPDTVCTNIDAFLTLLIPAMIEHENGMNPYSEEMISVGIKMEKEN